MNYRQLDEDSGDDCLADRSGASQTWQFTVGSLPNTRDQSEGFFNFKHELDLLKAALLYADRVKVCSVGAAFMAGLEDLRTMDNEGKTALVQRFLPYIQPNATLEDLARARKLIEAVSASGRRGRSARRGLSGPQIFAARQLLNNGWKPIKSIVEEQFKAVGAEGFQEALRSGLVELHPFTHISAEGIIDMGRRGKLGIPPNVHTNATYDEYTDRIFDTFQDGTTYPLFDDLTGNIVEEAVRNGVIVPSQGTVARGRHGGLSGDILQRLPLFERASVSAVLDIRKELAPYLDAFREAVGQFAEAIGPASWDEEFAEEAERIFREKVDTAVRRIDQVVEENRELRGLSLKYGPAAAAGAASALNAFVGSGSALASLALVAAGVYQGVSAHRLQHRQTQGNQLYFYYRASKLLRKNR